MPRNVRPSWINVEIEGKQTDIASGPRSRNGDMYVTIYVRNEGYVHKLMDVNLLANTAMVTALIDIDGLEPIRKEYNQ